MSHELYNLGHLYEAAAAHYQATGKKNLLDVAIKSADLVAREFGPGKRTNPPGHEEIEIGLVKLYRVTGTRTYLDLAKFFIDARGRTEGRIPFERDGKTGTPLRRVLAGREAVRRTDRGGRPRRPRRLPLRGRGRRRGADRRPALHRRARADLGGHGRQEAVHHRRHRRGRRLGGLRPRLPAAQRQRLRRDLREHRHVPLELADAAPAARREVRRRHGAHPLQRRAVGASRCRATGSSTRTRWPRSASTQRTPWFSCACCPPNVARILASVPGYFYAASNDSVYVNLYAQGTGHDDRGAAPNLELVQTTEYPWKGDIRIDVKPGRTDASSRCTSAIPGWALNRPVPVGPLRLHRARRAERRRSRSTARRWRSRLRDRATRSIDADLERPATASSSSLPMPVRRVSRPTRPSRPTAGGSRSSAGRSSTAPSGPTTTAASSNLVLPDERRADRRDARPDLLGGVVVDQGHGAGREREGRPGEREPEGHHADSVLRLGQPRRRRDGGVAGARPVEGARRARARARRRRRR